MGSVFASQVLLLLLLLLLLLRKLELKSLAVNDSTLMP